VRRPSLRAARRAARLIACSGYIRDSITAELGASDRVTVVPNGVDESEFFPLDDPAQRRRDQILFVGLIKYMKGVDVLLEAMRLVGERHQEARLVLAGGAFYRHTQAEEDEIRALTATLGIGDRVSFVGWQPPHVVARLMRESAVLVLPSRDESFGAVLIEALASGIPVVASDLGGPREIVDPNVGNLIPREDPSALAEAISRTLSHLDRYEPELLRRHALDRYGWSTVAGQIHDVYCNAVGVAAVSQPVGR